MSKWKWFVTVKAIRDAAYVLGYDPNVEEGSDDWDYLESLLGGLSLIARKKRDLDKPGLESAMGDETTEPGSERGAAARPRDGGRLQRTGRPPRMAGRSAPARVWAAIGVLAATPIFACNRGGSERAETTKIPGAEPSAVGPDPAPNPPPEPNCPDPISPRPPPEASVTEVDPRASSRKPGAAVRSVRADLDGDGSPDEVTLTEHGYLRYQRQLVPLEPVDLSGSEGGYDIVVVDLDAQRQALLVELPPDADEDPPRRYQIYTLLDGRLLNVVEERGLLTTPHGVLPTFTGPGKLHVVWTQCVRDADPQDARNGVESRIVEYFRWVPQMQEVAKVRMKRTFDDHTDCQFVACPFVRVDGRERGETLTNLHDESLAGTQITDLGTVEPGRLEIELSERKPEVTHLSQIVVRVGAQVLDPLRCSDSDPGITAGCGDATHPLLLRQGQAETFVFDVPNRGSAALHVSGYYLPTDQR